MKVKKRKGNSKRKKKKKSPTFPYQPKDNQENMMKAKRKS